MKLKLALCILAFPILSIAAPNKVAYEMVNKVNGEVVRTDILVKEGDKCKIYSKDIYQTYVTIYNCQLDASKFHMTSERATTCYAESSGEVPNRTYEADQLYNIKESTTTKIELKSRASEAEYELTVTLKKIDLTKVPERIRDSQCIL